MTLKEKLVEAQNNLKNVMEAVNKGEKTAEDLKAATEAVKEVQEKIKAADEAEKLLAGLKTPANDPADNEDKEAEFKTL